MSWFDPITVAGRFVTLEPLTADHAPELHSAADDPVIFRWTGPAVASLDDAVAYIDAALADRTRRPFLQRDSSTGSAVGTTSYYQVDSTHRSLAIGYTWLSRAAQGTAINPEAKYLLLQRAFDDLGAVRVEWHTDARNTQSRAAIAKLGASFEGILRKHRRLPDGTWRDTALFAMIDEQWPAARERLDARLATF